MRQVDTDLLVIGSGLSGMAAALFASDRNIKTVMAGAAGGFEYASGLLDLWGVALNRKQITKKPWDMISRLSSQMPGHPFNRISRKDLEKAVEKFISFLNRFGLAYQGYPVLNSVVLTPFGTPHPTYRMPSTMAASQKAYKQKPPCLVLDFRGLREFGARFFVQKLKKDWPDLSETTVEFPGTAARSEVYTPFLAQAFETQTVREQFVDRVKPMLENVEYLGLPAVLGIQSTQKIQHFLEEQLSVKVFEIPTSPISVPGIRLKETLFRILDDAGVIRLPNQRVTQIIKMTDAGIVCRTGSEQQPVQISAKAVILATGRFLSKGLISDRDKIFEPLFSLPVAQPETRRQWHREHYFDRSGHPVNQAGIEIDDSFRPVDKAGVVIYENLFAAGSILAHQDWIRSRCGAGLSIGTGFKAVQSYLQI